MTLSDHPGNGSSVRLHLLGAAWLARPGQAPLRFLPERRFRLLSYLGVRGDWVSRDQLAALFWPDRTQEAARSNLRKLLLEVRAIDPPMFEMDRNGLRWSVPTDLTQFTAAYRRGDHEAALAVFTGPLLQGIDTGDGTAFACWLGEERVRVQTVWRQCAGHALAQCTPADALDLCQRLLVEDPLDEDAVVAQLNALGALGREGERADVFRLYVTRLVEELGVEPSARVRAAAAPDTALAPAASTLSGSVPSDGFIGRGGDLEHLPGGAVLFALGDIGQGSGGEGNAAAIGRNGHGADALEARDILGRHRAGMRGRGGERDGSKQGGGKNGPVHDLQKSLVMGVGTDG